MASSYSYYQQRQRQRQRQRQLMLYNASSSPNSQFTSINTMPFILTEETMVFDAISPGNIVRSRRPLIYSDETVIFDAVSANNIVNSPFIHSEETMMFDAISASNVVHSRRPRPTPTRTTPLINLQRVKLNGKSVDNGACAICLDEFAAAGERSSVMRTPCSHLFHEKCIKKWLEKKPNCPLCRSRMAA
uniref:RING-type domain-containing protein n=1 Tax=Kalanchoe fedtschenkoi TaxID=63787 RepID=A0A7N0U1U7_KALFE